MITPEFRKQILLFAREGKTKEALSLVTEELTRSLGCTRASIWLFNVSHDRIDCIDLYDTRTEKHLSGISLQEEDFPTYFSVIKDESYVVAPEAREHPATREFTELYFEPNDIWSLLDHIISEDENFMGGVICCENCEDVKQWTPEDKGILESMVFAVKLLLKKK